MSTTKILAPVEGSPPDEAVAVKRFTTCDRFTTFWAEYRVEGEDYVAHFFPSPEADPAFRTRVYWEQVFPQAMSDVAEQYFHATLPRIFAERVEGVIPSTASPETPASLSWYFRARGFALRLQPDEFLVGFFRAIDARVESLKNT